MMTDKELDNLVRENYKKANTEYLLEQAREAVTPHAYWTVENTVMAKFVKCSNCGIHIRVAREGKENERYYLYPDEMNFCPNCGARMGEVPENDGL